MSEDVKEPQVWAGTKPVAQHPQSILTMLENLFKTPIEVHLAGDKFEPTPECPHFRYGLRSVAMDNNGRCLVEALGARTEIKDGRSRTREQHEIFNLDYVSKIVVSSELV